MNFPEYHLCDWKGFLSFVCLSLLAGYACGESLSWDDCVKEALKGNPDLVSAAETIKQSEAGVTISRSKRLPEISSTLSGGRSEVDEAGADNSYSYGISAKQLVFDGGKTSSDVKRSREQLMATKFKYDVTSSNVRRNLRMVFIDLLRSQRQVTIMEDILNRRRQSTKLIRLRYEGGREHKGSLLTAEAKEAQSEFDLAQARRNVDMAQSNLRELLGRPAGAGTDLLTVQGKFETAPVDKTKPDFVKLAENTPLVRELMTQSNVARLGVKSAKAEFYPGVYASADASRSASDWPPDKDQWSVGLSMSLPLFEGGSRVADVRRANSVVRQAEADEKSTFLNAAAALQVKWISMQNAIERVRVKEKFLDAARERAKIAEGQYSASLIVFDSWIIIEDEFVQADQALIEAQAAALTAEAEWVYSKGGTLENESK